MPEAEPSCSLVLEMEPGFWARYFRGLKYEQQGRFAQAMRDLQQAIDTCGETRCQWERSLTFMRRRKTK
jgi:hypothetical protein